MKPVFTGSQADSADSAKYLMHDIALAAGELTKPSMGTRGY